MIVPQAPPATIFPEHQRQEQTIKLSLQDSTETPLTITLEEEPQVPQSISWHTETVKSGDSLSILFNRAGLPDTSLYSLTIDEFQGHYHNVAGDTGFTVLNYSAQHDIGGDGKGPRANTANASGGNTLEETSTSIISGDPGHDHTITRPYVYTSDFTYSHTNIDVPLDDMTSTVDVDVENLNVLNQVVTPFILVHYIIKF